MTAGVEILRVAERALLVRFGDADLARAVERAWRLDDRLGREPLPGCVERVLGAGNLLLRFERGARLDRNGLARRLERLAAAGPPADGQERTGREHRFAVDYGGASGPDLDAVASAAGLAPERVVELHSGALYRVAFLGFSPGFPYLIGLPRELELPRRETPRPRVPAGSVAIAGAFGGIYPSATPGGWHLLGRTGARLFDPAATPPAALAPGDRVRFEARR